MKDTTKVKYYSPAEEWINISSHAVGLVLSVVALTLLVMHANLNGNVWKKMAKLEKDHALYKKSKTMQPIIPPRTPPAPEKEAATPKPESITEQNIE